MPKIIMPNEQRDRFTKEVFDGNLSFYAAKRLAKSKYKIVVSDGFVRVGLRRLGLFEEWKKREPSRRSMRMRGNKNGSHPPSVLIPKAQLKRAIDEGWTRLEMSQFFSVSEFLLIRNLEYHGLRASCRSLNAVVYRVDGGDFSLREVVAAMGLEPLCSILGKSNPTQDDLLRVREVHRQLLHTCALVQDIGRRVRSRAGLRESPVTFTTNRGEVAFEDYFFPIVRKHKLTIEAQKRLTGDDGVYGIFDYYVKEWRLLIELNGSYHFTQQAKRQDAFKRRLADKAGLSVAVIDVGGKTFDGIPARIAQIEKQYGTTTRKRPIK